MAFLVTATARTSWSLNNYFQYVYGTAMPTNGVNLTSVTFTNDDPANLFDRRITFTGTGIFTDNLGNIVAGNITGIKITGLTGSPTYYDMTVTTPLFGSDFGLAFALLNSSGNTDFSALDAIFRAQTYVFTGGTDDDFFEGGNVHDLLNGNGGEDVLLGLAGKDTINGGGGDDIIEGGAGDDIINGGSGDDYISTGDGVNVVTGGTGADMIEGGGTADTITFAAALVGVGVDLDAGGFAGDALDDSYNGIEGVIGSTFKDTLRGDNVAETLDGGKGSDFLMGRGGADTLIGGDGTDTASYAESGGVAVDLSIVGAQVSPGEASGDQLAGIENLIGSTNSDQLTGNGLANRIDGGLGFGNDTLEGLGGADTLIGGSGNNDRASYTQSLVGVTVDLRLATAQKSFGDASGDVLTGFEEVAGSINNDILFGDGHDANKQFPFSNRLYGNGGNDTLIGGKDGDILDGGFGIDTASYATATGAVNANIGGGGGTLGDAEFDVFVDIENLIGSSFDDNLVGNAFANKIEGGDGRDLINGEDGNDELRGGAGKDRMFGGFDQDQLFGDAGKDSLDGGGNDDTLTGGADRDTFVASSGVDLFTDFKAGTGGDYFDVRSLAFSTHQDIFNLLSQNGANVEIDFGGGDMAILANVQVGQLTAGNFLIHF